MKLYQQSALHDKALLSTATGKLLLIQCIVKQFSGERTTYTTQFGLFGLSHFASQFGTPDDNAYTLKGLVFNCFEVIVTIFISRDSSFLTINN